jgi:uncharacterized membrane protein
MLDKIFWLIVLTLIPALELRLSIPVGILQNSVALPFGLAFQGFGLAWPIVFLVCVATNMALGPMVYFLLNKFVHFFLRFSWFASHYNRQVLHTQKKIQPFVQKYGHFGVALFIAVPLPGSGSYTGALAAYLLGIDPKKFMLINAVGVFIAGVLVTLIALGFFTAFGL